MTNFRVISSDSHVFEPIDLWSTRIEPKFRDRAPHIVREEGSDWWYCDGKKLISFQNSGAQAGVRFEDPEKLTRSDTAENARPGAYIPEEHVKDMDIDGVEAGVIYPTVGLFIYSVPNSEIVTAAFRAYNDWMAEFCRPYPTRLKGVALLNIDDVRTGVSEMERCAKMGLVGAMIPAYTGEVTSYESPEYEPLWAAAEELEMPLSLHVSTKRGQGITPDFMKLSTLVNVDHWVRMSIADIILSGVFERHPKLHVGSVEHELGWIPHFLERMDYAYTQRPPTDAAQHRFNEDMLPSDYFHRNVFLSFQEDALGLKLRDAIGVDNLMWGSDYPHQESTFPRSREILEKILDDCTEEEKAKIAGGNAARLYRLN